MGLRDVLLKKAYSSDIDNILQDFYIPALANAKEYCRLAGFFSSTSLAVTAQGVLGLIKNNGTMKLLVSPRLQKRDVEAIRTSTTSPEKYFEKSMLTELDDLQDEFIKHHVFALGWMIANKRLDIKVAVVYDRHGNPMGYEDIQQRGLFHQKVGILKDKEGNLVTFSGSVNETAFAWLDNIEEFKTFRSWHPTEKEYVESDVNKFERFWNGLPARMKVMDIPCAVEKKLIEIAPVELDEINLPKVYERLTQTQSIQLYPHQKDAVNAWLENEHQGIFEMATGTGKTFTALGCLRQASQDFQSLLTIITCPYQHLVQQWKREVDKFGIKHDDLIIADSSNPKWKDALTDSLIDLALGYKQKLLVLTTHRSFSSDSFIDIISDNKREFKIFVIGDEVHGLGAEKSQEGLIDEYDIRLGLSATPKRWFDTPGTRAIYDYFGGIIYEFGLRDAINQINPATGRTYLTPYRYMPRFISLSPEEVKEYTKKTRAIGIRFNRSKEEGVKDSLLERLLFRRADIIKNAQAKYEILENLLDEISPLKWTIIYCSPQQIDTVMKIMNKRRIAAHRFTMEEGTTPSKRYNGLSERQFLLKKFAEEKYQVLVAMKCLDEGVDVPPARTAVLMANSGNPRQYVQRIGRVIRRYSGKTEASIYDIIVAPSLGPLSSEISTAEWTIFKKEIERYEDIARNAINSAESLKEIYHVKRKVLEVRR
jgi:superfamily II DNA or RNA helicase